MDTQKKQKIMSLYEALKTKLFESVYDAFDHTVIDPHNGHRVDVNQAVKRSLLGHDTCLVYHTDKNRQVCFVLDSCYENGNEVLACIRFTHSKVSPLVLVLHIMYM